MAALICGASMGARVHAEDEAPCKPELWKEDMAAFKKADAEHAPPRDALLFVGSSSIRMWDVAKWFPNVSTINRGFGGSQICDSTHWADLLVIKLQPRAIFFYAGDNDIAAGKKAERVQRDFREFVAKVHKPLPKTPIVFISIKPSTARWKLADEMKKANQLIAADCKKDNALAFIDVWPKMLGADGKPRNELLREDGLHMTDAGYEIWTKLVKKELETFDAMSRER